MILYGCPATGIVSLCPVIGTFTLARISISIIIKNVISKKVIISISMKKLSEM